MSKLYLCAKQGNEEGFSQNKTIRTVARNSEKTATEPS